MLSAALAPPLYDETYAISRLFCETELGGLMVDDVSVPEAV
jgi:hypothetical protein